MSQIRTGVKPHDDVLALSEQTRQTACVGATQAVCRTAEIAHYRTCLASAIANNCGVTQFVRALQELGTGRYLDVNRR